jgi:hypothetical protein
MAAGTKVSYTETVVRNMSAAEKYFGFLPPHGKRLKALGDSGGHDYFTFKGDLESRIGTRKRLIDAFQRANDNGLIQTRVNKRIVYKGVVADGTAFTVGDLCYWDDSAKLIKPASSFSWDTDLLTTQTAYALVHLGVALESKGASDGTVVMHVDISPQSFFDFTIVAGTAYKIGQTFGPAKDTGNAIVSNVLVAAVAAASVAHLISDMTTASTQVLVSTSSAYNAS